MNISNELIKVANQYENIILSEELQNVGKELDNIEEGSYQQFIKAVNKPTRQNVMKYEKSITPKTTKSTK